MFAILGINHNIIDCNNVGDIKVQVLMAYGMQPQYVQQYVLEL